MLSWKAIVITLVLSLTGALFVQHWSDGPAELTPPGAEPDGTAGPSGSEASALATSGLRDADVSSPSAQSSPTDTADAARGAPSGRDDSPPERVASTGAPLTRPYLEDDRDLAAEIAAAGEPPGPAPMTAADRALLEALEIDLDSAGVADESTDFVDWFPGRSENLFGADGRPLPQRTDSIPADPRN